MGGDWGRIYCGFYPVRRTVTSTTQWENQPHQGGGRGESSVFNFVRAPEHSYSASVRKWPWLHNSCRLAAGRSSRLREDKGDCCWIWLPPPLLVSAARLTGTDSITGLMGSEQGRIRNSKTKAVLYLRLKDWVLDVLYCKDVMEVLDVMYRTVRVPGNCCSVG